MTSKIKVDNINKVSDDSNIIKKCGTTTTIGSGASNPIVVDGSAVTLGRCGGTVALASGATQTGFGRTGTVNWITTKKTTGFTAVSGEGYFCDTAASGAFTLTLPASPSAGDIVGLKDYNGNFATANLTIGRNGEPINGGNATDVVINTNGASIFLVYVDASQGWVATQDDSSTFSGASFICASVSGACNTLTISGDCKIATFKGPGTFTVNSISSTAPENTVSYLVVAGGGGSASDRGGAGGAGGFREYKAPHQSYTASPLNGNPGGTAITVTAQAYSVVIGGGGAGNTTPPFANPGTSGGNSSFGGITSAGGGGAGGYGNSGLSGGSGGGSGTTIGSGAGNTPSVSPPQGKDGGLADRTAPSPISSAGGGGATAVGKNGDGPTNPGQGGPGGAGAGTLINPAVGESGPGCLQYFSGGGGGGQCTAAKGIGGVGGGGDGASGPYPGSSVAAEAGTDNTGGGAGGSNGGGPSQPAKNGGSGIVIIRYKFQ